MTPTVLDATAGGKHIWHRQMEDADHVVFADRRVVEGHELQPGWECRPDLLADFRELPFADASFDLVCFDPPHRVTDEGMAQLSGVIEHKYGALRAETWQADLREAFNELWRVLRPGGTLTLKWADRTRGVSQTHEAVLELLPKTPLYGTNIGNGKTDTRWWVFHKPQPQSSQEQRKPIMADGGFTSLVEPGGGDE